MVRELLPDPLPNLGLERLEIPRGERLVGVPHTPGTREYLTCEQGRVQLVAGGDSWELAPGDVVVFRGDQKHSYINVGEETAIAYSVIALL